MLFLLFQFIEEKVTYFDIQMMTGVATSYMVVFIGIYLSIELVFLLRLTQRNIVMC